LFTFQDVLTFIGNQPTPIALGSMYDYYRIRKVEFKIDYICPNILGPVSFNTGVTTIPEIMYTYDDNDAGLPVSVNSMSSRPYYIKKLEQSKTCMITIYPKPSVLMGQPQTLVPTGRKEGKNTDWIHHLDLLVEYYGIKMMINNMNAGLGNAQYIRFSPSYYMEFKSPIFI